MEQIVEKSTEAITVSLDAAQKATTEEPENEPVTEKRSTISDPVLGDFTSLLGKVVADTESTLNAPIPNITSSVFTGYSLAAFLDLLSINSRTEFLSQLHDQCKNTILETFKFSDGHCFLHEDYLEGMVRLVTLQLLNHYPKYSTQGYEALYSCPPVLYVSSLCSPTLGSSLCKKLGLPLNCVRTVDMVFTQKDSSSEGGHHFPLAKALEEDVAAKKVPLFLVGCLGSHHTGEFDNLPQIQQLCQRYNVWLHLEGNHLVSLALTDTVKEVFRLADSLHLELRPWLGIPGLPFATILRNCEVTLLRAANLVPVSSSATCTVPLWFALQNIGVGGIREKMSTAFDLSETLIQRLTEIPEMRITSYVPPGGKQFLKLVELSDKAPDVEVLLSVPCPVVVFQYRPPTKEQSESFMDLIDDLNLWLAQVLQRTVAELPIDILDVPDQGYSLRFSPVDGRSVPSQENMAKLLNSLNQQLEILNATVEHKGTLRQVVEQSEELQVVELPGWAGLGGVRYVPAAWRSKPVEQLPDQGKEEINKINRQLVARLKSVDSAFSLGDGKDGLLCVRFGMVVANTDVEALANLVRQTGMDLEASSSALETMAVLVRKGIEEAQAEMQRETEEQLWQEGILRHIPVVGSLVSWFSPPPSANRIKGRTFNLPAGRMVSSDELFKTPSNSNSPALSESAQ